MVLIITLIMLTMLTMLGVIALRSATSEERIASNIRDRQLVFEYAESGLRKCQDALLAGTFTGTARARPTSADPNYWAVASNWNGNAAVVDYSPSSREFSVKCMAENIWLGTGQVGGGFLLESRYGYRATVRASRSDGGTEVMVQSVFPSL
ncbi:pilus assembly PilX family protein [Derxia gummosa]|uniref:Pilus assembly PilX family protein n=1 Tax=Derxia gummosa DSM 723 TaxID=1121388 RepID=A0A8B6XB90_9BURK|nr:PilX N-terminal domain-containing pilus assembly protein [Derxia gummosa]